MNIQLCVRERILFASAVINMQHLQYEECQQTVADAPFVWIKVHFHVLYWTLPGGIRRSREAFPPFFNLVSFHI